MAPNFTAVVVALLATLTVVNCRHGFTSTGNAIDIENRWEDAHATFYGDIKGGQTMTGACGYDDHFNQIYGLATTALSTVLFKNGATCGACFELLCANSPQWCIKRASIRVTTTTFCPPNYTKTLGVWCNPPQKHFDLSLPMFLKIAKYRAGIVPVKYRRVLCKGRSSAGSEHELWFIF